VRLQLPRLSGFGSQRSLHVRNDHANLQSGSTACCCPDGAPASAASSTPAVIGTLVADHGIPAASMDCARRLVDITRLTRPVHTIAASSEYTAAATAPSHRASNMAARSEALPDANAGGLYKIPVRIASRVRIISSGRYKNTQTRWVSKIRLPLTTMRSTSLTQQTKASPICPQCRSDRRGHTDRVTSYKTIFKSPQQPVPANRDPRRLRL